MILVTVGLLALGVLCLAAPNDRANSHIFHLVGVCFTLASMVAVLAQALFF